MVEQIKKSDVTIRLSNASFFFTYIGVLSIFVSLLAVMPAYYSGQATPPVITIVALAISTPVGMFATAWFLKSLAMLSENIDWIKGQRRT